MEQLNVISILGVDPRFLNRGSDLDQAIRKLNRETLKLHGRHLLTWLLRSLFVLCLFLLGRFGLEGAAGGALAWTSGFLALYVGWYAMKGHVTIQGDRRARLYWLVNDAGNREFCSDDPIVASMPAQESLAGANWYPKATA